MDSTSRGGKILELQKYDEDFRLLQDRMREILEELARRNEVGRERM